MPRALRQADLNRHRSRDSVLAWTDQRDARRVRPDEFIAHAVIVDVEPRFLGKLAGQLGGSRIRVGLGVEEHRRPAPHIDDPVFDVPLGIGQPGAVVVAKPLQGHGRRSQNPVIRGPDAPARADSRVVVQPELSAVARRLGFQHAVGNPPVRVADENVGPQECRHVVRRRRYRDGLGVSVHRHDLGAVLGTLHRDTATVFGQLRSADQRDRYGHACSLRVEPESPRQAE